MSSFALTEHQMSAAGSDTRLFIHIDSDDVITEAAFFSNNPRPLSGETTFLSLTASKLRSPAFRQGRGHTMW